MNECDLYQELISRLVDGELNKNEYAALKEHLENCSDCSAMYAVFASLSDIIGSEDEPLPEDLHENIMAGVRRHAMIQNNKRRLSKPMRNTLAAAACAALVLFAARGLSPAQKAQDAVLNESQAAAMDAAVQTEAVEESLPAPAAVMEEAAPAATETPVPTATPVPTKDVYLSSGEDKEQTDTAKNNTKTDYNYSANTNNKASGGTVYITAPPQEIVVSTPAPTPKATPVPTVAPTAAPTPAPTVAPTAAPTPVPTVAATEMPIATASLEAGDESAAVAPAATEAAAETQTSEVPAAAAGSEPAASAAPTEAPAEPSETPGRRFGLFSFFASRNSLEADVMTAAEEPEAESDALGSPAVPSPIPAEEAEEEEEILIKLIELEKLTELEDLIDGEETELPEDEADASYSFCMKEPDELTKDYKLTVHIYGDKVYYEQFFAPEDSIACLAKCSVEDFEKFLDSLSDEEKAPLMVSPSPSPAAETVSPSASPAQPSESPAASAEPAAAEE